MAEDDKQKVLPINVIIDQAEDLFDSGNRWDAIELLDKFRENISPENADAQMLYCRVADSLRENGEYAGANQALIQAFMNRNDANAVHDTLLMKSIKDTQKELSQDSVYILGKNHILDHLNIMHDALYPFVQDTPVQSFKPSEPDEEQGLGYEIA